MTEQRHWTLLVAIIFSTILPLTEFATFQAYVVTMGVYSVVTIFLLRETTILRIDKPLILLLSVIWGVYLLHAFTPSNQIAAMASLQRIPVFTIAIVINVFLLPSVVRFWDFVYVIAGVGAFLTLIGMPTLAGLSLDLGVIGVAPYEEIYYSPILINQRVPVLTSIFIDSNFMGQFLTMAIVCAVALADKHESRVAVAFFTLNGLGIYLTQSRMAMGSAALGVSLILSYRYLNRHSFYLLMTGGGVTGLLALPILLGILSGPSFVPQPDLRGRIELWRAAVEAFREQPLFGYGAGNTIEPLREHVEPRLEGVATHNSYIRMFVTTGVFGGLAYTGLILYVLLKQFVTLQSKRSVAIAGLLLSISTAQFFLSFTIFGISSSSVISSIIIGYSLNDRL